MHFDLANGKICLTKTDCAGVIWRILVLLIKANGPINHSQLFVALFWHARVPSEGYMQTQIALTFTNWVALNFLLDGLCI